MEALNIIAGLLGLTLLCVAHMAYTLRNMPDSVFRFIKKE